MTWSEVPAISDNNFCSLIDKNEKNKTKSSSCFLKPCLHSHGIKLTFDEKPPFSMNKQRPATEKSYLRWNAIF